MLKRIFPLLLMTALIPEVSFAGVVFSEIMYDLEEGSDSGREWVEIYNGSNSGVDITNWKFFENDTNHSLVLIQGNAVLEQNGYVIIVSDPDKFFSDYNNYAGTVFDSSFSLSNEGEEISLKKDDGEIIDRVSYESGWGAAGDGNSLQYSGGKWNIAKPTPGSGFTQSAGADGNLDTSSLNQTQIENNVGGSQQSSSQLNNVYDAEPNIKADAGPDRNAIVGADESYVGLALGLKGEPIDNARYLWNFGDGTFSEGRSVIHHYKYPGEYIVVLDVSSGGFGASDRVVVKVREPKIIIQPADDSYRALQVINQAPVEIDLSWWSMAVAGKIFYFPKNTLVISNGKIILANEITGFSVIPGTVVELYYPNGSKAGTFDIAPVSTPASVPNKEKSPPQRVISAEDKIVGSEEIPVLNNPDIETAENFTASVSKVENNNVSYKWYWILSVILFVGMGITGLLAFKQNEIDEYTIIEDKDE